MAASVMVEFDDAHKLKFFVVAMLTFWKINSESNPEWDDDPQDSNTFIVIVAVRKHEFDVSNCLLTSEKKSRARSSRNVT